jgi:arylsulfatase A-like enzyme
MASFLCAQGGQAQVKKPNILVIFGDDVGLTDISAYSMGMMAFKAPNIDRIAREGTSGVPKHLF